LTLSIGLEPDYILLCSVACSIVMSMSGGMDSSLLSIPSPIPHRRNRTESQCEKAAKADEGEGEILSFCREKGHGFVQTKDHGPLFVHVSDIEGEVIPKPGDHVKFRMIPLPQNSKKLQAVHVRITDFTGERHQRWEDPVKNM
uniref:Cold shock domain-containing protein CG9705 n=2 Tax=Schistocephalus solidus TaxID=70667 RepID=A0A183SWR3_SCHSO